MGGEGYTKYFEEESLYSKDNLEKLKNDFTKLGTIDGKDKQTFQRWVSKIDQKDGIFDLKIDNKEMEADDFDKDINTVGSARQDKVAEKRRLFFVELYKPLNNPKDFGDCKIDPYLGERLNESKSRQNWENFAKNDDVLNYRELLSKTAEEERKTLCKFLKKSKNSSEKRDRDDEEYTPNDKQNELNLFADISKTFPPDDSIPILKKSDYITFEFLEELKDICSRKEDKKKDDMERISKKYSEYDLDDDNYDLTNDIDDLDDDRYDLNNVNEKQTEESGDESKYYFPELYTFLSVNLENLINITDQYKSQISKLGGDKKVEETKKDDDDYYRDKPKEKSSVNDLKLQLERINVAALNFIITFATSDLKTNYVDNYEEIKVLSKMGEKKDPNELPGNKACAFLSTLISNSQAQLKIHENKMSSLEENNDINLLHAKEKHDFIPDIINECFPTNQPPEIDNLKKEFYDDTKEILNKISDDEDNNNTIKEFLYSKSGLKFIMNVNSKFNEKLIEKEKLNKKREESLKKSKEKIGKLSDKQSAKNESKKKEIDRLANIKDYNSEELNIIRNQSECYKKIAKKIIEYFDKELNSYCDNAEEKIKELTSVINIIRENYKNSPSNAKGIADKLRKLKYDLGKELGKQNEKYNPIYIQKIDTIKLDLSDINIESGWNKENEEILNNLFEKEKNIKEKINAIDEEINSDEVKEAMKTSEEIENEIKEINKEIKITDAMKTSEETKNETIEQDDKSEIKSSNEFIDKNRVQYINNYKKHNYNRNNLYHNNKAKRFNNRNQNNFQNFYKNYYQ